MLGILLAALLVLNPARAVDKDTPTLLLPSHQEIDAYFGWPDENWSVGKFVMSDKLFEWPLPIRFQPYGNGPDNVTVMVDISYPVKECVGILVTVMKMKDNEPSVLPYETKELLVRRCIEKSA